MEIPKDPLIQVFEIEKTVEVVLPDDHRATLEKNGQGGTDAKRVPRQRFRIFAAKNLSDQTPPAYVARIEKLIEVESRTIHVWRDVTDHFSVNSGPSTDVCIGLALACITSPR